MSPNLSQTSFEWNTSNVFSPDKIDSQHRLGEATEGVQRPGKANGVEAEGSSVAKEGSENMPGMLKRAHDCVDPDSADAKQGDHGGEGPRKRQATGQVNGGYEIGGLSSMNGVYANGVAQDASVTGESLVDAVEKLAEEAPPELYHITQGFVPLSQLVNRLAQDTFSSLNDLINELADMPVSEADGHGASQGTTANVNKKTKLWDFAHDRRAKFIKLLVLSQWGRQSEAVSKVIDLNHWIMTQKAYYKEAANWMGELKRITSSMKVQSPDLKTTLETLSTGRATWIPDVSRSPPVFNVFAGSPLTLTFV